MLEDLAKKFKEWFDKDGQHMIHKVIDVSHVDKADDYVPLEHGKHYVKLWLSEMFLRKQVQLGQQFFPAVHSLSRFSFGAERVEVPYVADASRVGMKQDSRSGDVVARNFELTPHIPFNNGAIELDAGLIAVQGQNYLGTFINTLSDFASLLAVPQFSAALNVAQPLAKGVQSLLGDGALRLGLHDTLSKGQNGGYFVVVRATEREVLTDKLRVINSQLRYGTGNTEAETVPFADYDYMLFRVEVTDALPDDAWRNLPSINEPLSKIEDAYAKGDMQEAESLYRVAVVSIRRAKELTTAQRIQAQAAAKADYEGLKDGLTKGALDIFGGYSLGDTLKRLGLSADDALKQGDPGFADLIGE